MHHAWPVFRQQAYGRVVMATSSSGLVGNFGQANYGAAKSGMLGLMNVAKIEGEKYNIMVNMISPGAMTRMTENLMGGREGDQEEPQADHGPGPRGPGRDLPFVPAVPRNPASASTLRVARLAARRSSSPRASATTRTSSRTPTGFESQWGAITDMTARRLPGACARPAKSMPPRRLLPPRPNSARKRQREAAVRFE